MSKACSALSTPVTGGNVSFYNQTVNDEGGALPVFPTPTIGMIGVLAHQNLQATLDFKYKGDLIFLLGVARNDVNSSEYLHSIHGITNSPAPYFDMKEEMAYKAA